jgi:hypothetical protein
MNRCITAGILRDRDRKCLDRNYKQAESADEGSRNAIAYKGEGGAHEPSDGGQEIDGERRHELTSESLPFQPLQNRDAKQRIAFRHRVRAQQRLEPRVGVRHATFRH